MQFTCDHCGQVIDDPNQGIVTWDIIENPNKGKSTRGLYGNFRIVHRPDRDNLNNRCDTPGAFEDLSYFTGPGGLKVCLDLLDRGCITQEVTLLLRRTQLPYYEQARRYFKKAQADYDFWGTDLQDEDTMKRIIERYAQ
jgi:hypothetical protein